MMSNKGRSKRIPHTLEALKEYAQEHNVTVESAIRDWDEPWDFIYLYDLLTELHGVEPTPEKVCQLAGVNPEYWQQFMGRYGAFA